MIAMGFVTLRPDERGLVVIEQVKVDLGPFKFTIGTKSVPSSFCANSFLRAHQPFCFGTLLQA